MNEELKRQLQACIESFDDYQHLVTNDPECWTRWFGCVSHFQESEYAKASASAAGLLADRCLSNWFPVLQILLICLRHTHNTSDLDHWGARLVEAAPLTAWQASLATLLLDKVEPSSILS